MTLHRPAPAAPWPAASSGARGLSLLELLLVLAVLALALSLASPSFLAYRQAMQLKTLARSLQGALQLARNAAQLQTQDSWMVPADGRNWHSGWTVLMDRNASSQLEAGQKLVLLHHPPVPAGLRISANGTAQGASPYVRFLPSGSAATRNGGISNLRFTLVQAGPPGTPDWTRTRHIVLLASGRLRTCQPPGADAAAC